MGSAQSISDELSVYDENDENLVSASEELFDDGYITRYSKDFKRHKYTKFVPTAEPAGHIFRSQTGSSGGSGSSAVSRKVVSALVSDISALADDRRVNAFTGELRRRLFVIYKMHCAVRREIVRDRKRTAASATALQTRIRSDAPPLPASAKIGIKTAVRMFLLLVRDAERRNADIVSDVLELLEAVLGEAPPLSLVEGPGFSPDVAAGIAPLLDYIKALVSGPQHLRHKATNVLFGVALARGSASELLALVKLLLSTDDREGARSLFGVSRHLVSLIEYASPSCATLGHDNRKSDANPSNSEDAEEKDSSGSSPGGEGVDSRTASPFTNQYSVTEDDEEEYIRHQERRHSLAIVGASILAGRHPLPNTDGCNQSAEDRISLFPNSPADVMLHLAPQLSLGIDMETDGITETDASIIIMSQLDRLSSTFARKPDEDIWNDDPNRLAVLYEPLCVEVKPQTVHLLSDLLDMVSSGYFSSDGCPDSGFVKHMYMVVASLRILKAHLYQFVRAKLPKNEFQLPKATVECLRSRIFKFLETPCADRSGVLSSVAPLVSSVVQAEAAQILAEAFEFFYPAVSDQVTYLGHLVKLYTSSSQSHTEPSVLLSPNSRRNVCLSPPEQDLLDLLLTRFSSFNSGSLLLDELEQASGDDSVLLDSISSVLSALIAAGAHEAEATLRMKERSLAKSGIISVLINFQRHLLSRAGLYLCEDANGDEEEKESTNRTRSKLFGLVQTYACRLFAAGSRILCLAEEVITSDSTSEELRRVGEDILLDSIVGRLGRPLMTSLAFFSGEARISVKLLQVVAEFMERSDDLCSLVQSVSHPDEVMAVDKRRELQSRHPYRAGVDREEIITIKNAKSLIIVFDRERCSTASKDDFVQVFLKPNREDQITERAFGTPGGAAWPKDPIVVSGDTIALYFHTSANTRSAWGYRLSVVGTVLVRPLEWLSEFTKTTAWVAGRMASTLISGPPVSKSERDLIAKWTQLFRGGVEPTHSRYPCLSEQYFDTEKIPGNNSMELDCEAIPEPVPTQGESEFLSKIASNPSPLIELLNRCSPDQHIVQPSIREHASVAVRAVLALFLKHTGRISQAQSFLSENSGGAPLRLQEDLVRLWRKALEVKVEMRSLKAQGIDSSITLTSILERVEFLMEIARYDPGFPTNNQSELLSPRSSEQVQRRIQDSGSLEARLGNAEFLASEQQGQVEDEEQWQKAAVMTKLLKNTMKALRRLKELMLVRTRLAATKQDPESQFLELALAFVLEPSLSLQVVYSGLAMQRTRAMMRLEGLTFFRNTVFELKSKGLLPELLLHLSSAFREPIGEIPKSPLGILEQQQPVSGKEPTSVDVTKMHFLANVETIGQEFQQSVSGVFFDLVGHLMRNKELDDSSRIILLDILNMEFGSKDLAKLHEIGVIEFLEPLVSFPGTSPALLTLHGGDYCDKLIRNGRLRRQPWNTRFCAWSLLRMFSYSSLANGGSSDLQASIFDMLFEQVTALSAMRSLNTVMASEDAASLVEEGRYPVHFQQFMRSYALKDADDSWVCLICAFWNVSDDLPCCVCGTLKRSSDEILKAEREYEDNETKGMEFVYEHDFDNKGILYYLGTNGYTEAWRNPHDRGAVRCSASSLQGDSEPASAIAGLSLVRCVTQPKPNQCFMISFVDHVVCPTHYTLKHYSSWDTEALRSWRLEGSNDGGMSWTTLRDHVFDSALDHKGATHTWTIDPPVSESFSTFRVLMTDLNSNNHWYCSVSGIEIYGTLDADVEIPAIVGSGLAVGDRSSEAQDYFDRQDTIEVEFESDDPSRPITVIHTNTSESWHSVKGVRKYSSGRPYFDFRIDYDGGGSNTWRFIIGVVPAAFEINNASVWVGSQGGWGYIGGLGHKNFNSSTNVPYADTFTTGDVVGVQLDFSAGTVEFFKNNVSMGIAFENLEGPVHAAVSMTGPGSKVTFLQKNELEDESSLRTTEVADKQSWESRSKNFHLGDASISWYHANLQSGGFRGKALTQTEFPSQGELNCFLGQILWLILRCVRSVSVQKILSQKPWLDLLLGWADSGSPLNQVLSLRICRYLLPGISPTDQRITTIFESDKALVHRFLLKAATACLELPDELQDGVMLEDFSDSSVPASSVTAAYKAGVLARQTDRVGSDNFTWNVIQGSMTTQTDVITCQSGFGSVVASVGAARGKWYYEVALKTGGLFQLGWATREFSPAAASDGVGDCVESWAYDGNRCLRWHDGKEPYGDVNEAKWTLGGVVGCALDLDAGTISYFLNGKALGVAFENINVDSPLYPALSVWINEQCTVRLREADWSHSAPESHHALVAALSVTPISTAGLGEEAIASEYVSLSRVLMRSTLWKSLFGDILCSNVSSLSEIAISIERSVATVLKSKTTVPSSSAWLSELECLPQLKTAFAVLAVLGGSIEPIREGACVCILGENTEGTIAKITGGDKSFIVFTNAGDVVTIDDPKDLVALSGVDVSLSQIKSPLQILTLLGEFLSRDTPPPVYKFSASRQLFLKLQRVSLRVVLCLLQKREFISYFISKGYTLNLGRKALNVSEPLLDNFVNTVGNLECRVLALRQRRKDLSFPGAATSTDDSGIQVQFRGTAIRSLSIGAKHDSWESFDDFDFLTRNSIDDRSRVQEIAIVSDQEQLFGFEVQYTVDDEILVCDGHFSIGHMNAETSTVTLLTGEYIRSVIISYDPALLHVRYLSIRTNQENVYKFGNADVEEDSCQQLAAPSGRGIVAFFGSVNESGLGSLGIVHQEVYIQRLKTFKFVSNFDENGVLWWLGSKQGTSAWKNPMELGLVEVTVAKSKADSAPISAVVGREVVRCLCHDMPNGWFVIDLKEIRVRPSAYMLRHYSSWDTEALRNWNFEGSPDGGLTWILLRAHTNDTTLEQKGQAYTWPLSGVTQWFSQFRVYMTGPNSNDHNYLCLSGFELYGEVSMVTPERRRSSIVSESGRDSISAPLDIPAVVMPARKPTVEAGSIFSYGHGGSGRLGHGSTTDVVLPTKVSGLGTSIVELSAFNQHVLALAEDGSVFSWGNGADGRLGHGDVALVNAPKVISGLADVNIVQVRAGNSFSAVLDSSGKVWAFGKGNEGQLGNGFTHEVKEPIVVGGVLDGLEITRLGVGAFHVMVVSSTGEMYSWGRNLRGQLGLNTSVKKKLWPELVSGAPVFVSLCGGWDHSLGLTGDGLVYSWGNGYEGNRPATGLGHVDNILVPTLIETLREYSIVRIGSGWDHSMAITKEGKLYLWGSNGNGILGNGSTVNVSTPTLLAGSELCKDKIVWVEGGQNHTACVTDRGQLWTWGSFLGSESSTPVLCDPSSQNLFQSLACGDKCTFALSCDSVPNVPVSASAGIGSVDVTLPPYPKAAYLLGPYSGYIAHPRDLESYRLDLQVVRVDSGDPLVAAEVVLDTSSASHAVIFPSVLYAFQLKNGTELSVEAVRVTMSDTRLQSVVVFVTDDLEDSTICTIEECVFKHDGLPYESMAIGGCGQNNGVCVVRANCRHRGRYVVVRIVGLAPGLTTENISISGMEFSPSQVGDIARDFCGVSGHATVSSPMIDAVDGGLLSGGFNFPMVIGSEGSTLSFELRKSTENSAEAEESTLDILSVGTNTGEAVKLCFNSSYTEFTLIALGGAFRSTGVLQSSAFSEFVPCALAIDLIAGELRFYISGCLDTTLALGGSLMGAFRDQTKTSVRLGNNRCAFMCHIGVWETPLSDTHIVSVASCGLEFVANDDIEASRHHSRSVMVRCSSEMLPPLILSAKGSSLAPTHGLSSVDAFCLKCPGNPSGIYVDASTLAMQREQLAVFSIVMDVILPSPLPTGIILFSSDGISPFVGVRSDGRISIAGQPPGSRGKKVSASIWQRWVISVDLGSSHMVSVYLDGNLAASLHDLVLLEPVIYGIRSTFQVLALPCSLHRLQVRSEEALTQTAAMKLGFASDNFRDNRDILTAAHSLLAMGHPMVWCRKALAITEFNRAAAGDWIIANISRLQAEDKLDEYRKTASNLALMGFDPRLCAEALSVSEQDTSRAIVWLLDYMGSGRDIHPEYDGSSTDGPAIPSRVHNIEKSAPTNAAFKVLGSCSESMDLTAGFRVSRPAAARYISFPELNELSISDLDIAQDMTEEALLTAYSRASILSIMQNWPNNVPASLAPFGSERFLIKFARLVEFSQLRDSMDVLGGFLHRILLAEEESLSLSGSTEMSDVCVHAPVARALLVETLCQLVNLIADPTKKVISEADAINASSPYLILWILNLFGDLDKASEGEPLQIREMFFSAPVVNLIFEVIVVSSGEQRLSFVRLLSHLVKMGVCFDPEKTFVLKDLMNQMHVAQSPSGLYSNFFQALVELNVCLDNLATSALLTTEAEHTPDKVIEENPVMMDLDMKEEKDEKESDHMDVDDSLIVNEDSESPADGIQFIYMEDFDTNGILYYLGTNHLTSNWTNPAEAGTVKVTSSSLMNDSVAVCSVIGRESLRCVTQPIPNQWFQIDLIEHCVVPTHYTLRHYSSWDTEALRNWKLEGSKDGVTWVTLREHVNDASLCKKGQAFTWEIMDVDESYSKFRLYMTGLNSNQHWYMAVSGFEIYGTLDADLLSWEEEELEFNYEADLDENGILYHIGTHGKTHPWVNPAESGLVNVEASSLQHNSKEASSVVGRELVRCVTQPNPNQWFMIDLLERRVVPKLYTLRHYSTYDTEALRNWQLEGSNDGTNWIILRKHVNDSTLVAKGQAHTWELSGVEESFSMFRVFMTGKNSNDHWYLSLSGFEIYGTLLVKTGNRAKLPGSDSRRNKPWFQNIVKLDTILSSLSDAEFLKSVWVLVKKWPSEKEILKGIRDPEEHLVEFMSIQAQFDLGQDEQLVALVNRYAEKLDIHPWKMKASSFSPVVEDLIHFDKIERFSIRELQFRFFFLQKLNSKISSILPYIDFSLPIGISALADGIRRLRSLIFWRTKETLWTKALDSTSTTPSDFELELDRFKASKLIAKNKVDVKGRRSLFGQAFQQLGNRDAKMFRLEKGKQAWKTLFKGEHSDDYGGPYRNAIEDMCAELQSSTLPLLIRCPNGRDNIGLNRDKWVPRPSSKSPLHLRMYEFMGKLMGLAMRTKCVLDLDLPSIITKALVGESITEEDVLGIDLLSFKILDQLKKLESSSIDPALFEECVSSNFVAVGSDQKLYSLIPGGESIPVTWENRHDFVNALVQYRADEFNSQAAAIRRGLATVVPFPLLSLFTWEELEVQVCGRPAMNVDLLERMTVYDGCQKSDPHIVLFWKMLRERLDDEERCKFLRFVWGRSRLPLRAEEFERKLKISRMHKSDAAPDDYLPISHTCFFSIDLPRYSSLDAMHQKVLYAITHCVAIGNLGSCHNF